LAMKIHRMRTPDLCCPNEKESEMMTVSMSCIGKKIKRSFASSFCFSKFSFEIVSRFQFVWHESDMSNVDRFLLSPNPCQLSQTETGKAIEFRYI
jgi:hypothetical protein